MNSLRYVGLDVHKETIAVAVAEEGRAAPTSMGTIPNDPAAVRKLIRQLGGRARLRCCYEAGPCGYVLYHQLTDQGVSCQVVAPSLVPRRPGDGVKTDRRDALKLALGLRAGTLTSIWVPDPADEALRDLVRAREDALEDLLRARHRLSKLLLRAGVRAPRDLRPWGAKHREWLAQVSWPHPTQQIAFEHYRLNIDQALARVASLDRHLLEMVGESRFAEMIAAFQALYGVGFVTALTVATEVQNFSRFSKAPSFMGFTGVCSERTFQRREPMARGHYPCGQPACPPSRGGSGLAITPSTEGHGPTASRARRAAALAADDCRPGGRAIEPPLRPAVGAAQTSAESRGGSGARTSRVHVVDRLRAGTPTDGDGCLKTSKEAKH